jgi:hypothetical protein
MNVRPTCPEIGHWLLATGPDALTGLEGTTAVSA